MQRDEGEWSRAQNWTQSNTETTVTLDSNAGPRHDVVVVTAEQAHTESHPRECQEGEGRAGQGRCEWTRAQSRKWEAKREITEEGFDFWKHETNNKKAEESSAWLWRMFVLSWLFVFIIYLSLCLETGLSFVKTLFVVSQRATREICRWALLCTHRFYLTRPKSPLSVSLFAFLRHFHAAVAWPARRQHFVVS